MIMKPQSRHIVWQLPIAFLAILILTSCSLSLPVQAPAVEVPQAQQGGETLPSEADLYATAIASLGGQLTETAVFQWPTPPIGEGTLTWVTPIPSEEMGWMLETETPEEGAEGTPQRTPTKTKTATPQRTITSWPTITPAGIAWGGGPYTYYVQRGDWLYKIARRFGVSANAIIAANPRLAYNPSHIVTGQVLIIPAPGTYTYPYPFATSAWLPEYYWSYGTPLPISTPAYLPEYYWNWGPESWGSISSSYNLCSSGTMQSPVNIDTARTQAKSMQIDFRYSPADLRLISNDYTFQADYPNGSYVQIDGVIYELIDITFHLPSEHTINGHAFAMELQLVHQNSQGQTAVISVLVDEGDNNSNLEPIWSNIPAPPYNWTEVRDFNASNLLPSDLRAYKYIGSITTPPCTENVLWIVMASTIEMSQEQLDTFSSMFPGNARPVQPLNNRIIYSNFAGQ
jgi:carbonic anhydrase